MIRVKTSLVMIALGLVLLALTACGTENGDSKNASGKPGELSGPVGVLVANYVPTIPAAQRCRFECSQRDMDLKDMHIVEAPASDCTLQDVVDRFGPPEKVLIIRYGTDYVDNTSLELVYPNKGLTFGRTTSVSDYPDSPPQLERSKPVGLLYCYVPTTFDEYYDRAVNGKKTIVTVEDWKGFKK